MYKIKYAKGLYVFRLFARMGFKTSGFLTVVYASNILNRIKYLLLKYTVH